MTSGALAPGAAEPLFVESTLLEFAAIPPAPGAFDRPDLPGEPLVGETGSVGAERSDPAAPEPPIAVDRDPWADAFATSQVGLFVPREEPPYPVVLNAQVRAVLDRFTGARRAVVELWLSRSGRYLDMIRAVLRRHGLPEDLAFIAMIESGFDPAAVSRAGAKGLWQFMAGTARRYGLRVDQWIDERLDPDKSTVAAASYLKDLHDLFGSWVLAQAAYNAGEVRVARAIRFARSDDFWALVRTNLLRQETREFVPQIHAATLIGRDPARYGFEVSPPAPPSTETVSVPPLTDLRRLSAFLRLPADRLRALNIVLVRGVTPPGERFALKVPAGTGNEVLAALTLAPPGRAIAQAKGPVRAARTTEIHVVRPRDTVSSIAKRYGVSVGDLLRWNSLGHQDRIRPGDRLHVAGARPSERETPHGLR